MTKRLTGERALEAQVENLEQELEFLYEVQVKLNDQLDNLTDVCLALIDDGMLPPAAQEQLVGALSFIGAAKRIA